MANSNGQGGSAYPKSVQAGIPRLEVPDGWTAPKIGKLFKVVKRPVDLVDDDEYQLVTARRNRGGIVARERLRGKDILTKSQFRVAEGDFLISRRQIAHGACGIVPAELEGAVVSNEYAVLRPTDLLDIGYMRHLPHSIYFQQTCFHSSIGVHVEKLVFNLEDWFRWKIAIPGVSIQQEIAGVLDAWDNAVVVSRATEKLKAQGFRALSRKIFSPFLEGGSPLKRLFHSPESGAWGDEPDTGANQKVVRNADFIQGGRISLEKAPFRKLNSHELAKTQLCRDDILLEKSGGSPDQPVGRVALYDQETNAGFSNFLMRLRTKTNVDPRFAYHLMNTLYLNGRPHRFQQQTTGIRNLEWRDYLMQGVSVPAVSDQAIVANVCESFRHSWLEQGQLGKRIASQRHAVRKKVLDGHLYPSSAKAADEASA